MQSFLWYGANLTNPTEQESCTLNLYTKTDKNRGRKHVSNPKTRGNETRVGTSVSEGCLYTAVQSRGRGVDITEESYTETEYIGWGLQTAASLNFCEEEEEEEEEG
jgi:hypothetical protein